MPVSTHSRRQSPESHGLVTRGPPHPQPTDDLLRANPDLSSEQRATRVPTMLPSERRARQHSGHGNPRILIDDDCDLSALIHAAVGPVGRMARVGLARGRHAAEHFVLAVTQFPRTFRGVSAQLDRGPCRCAGACAVRAGTHCSPFAMLGYQRTLPDLFW